MNDAAQGESSQPKWRPLGHVERRVLGVLIEKAKTTPESYPLTLNAIRVGANQKSNRFPQMNLEADDVEETLDRLREKEAVSEIVGGGRVSKYRHRAYDWLGVEKVELAVMAELLLRGAQTVGELRGRAARMEPIADLAALRPVLNSLRAKNLLVQLTPPGRGAVVTHNLYQPSELERVRREHGGGRAAEAGIDEPDFEAAGDVAGTPPPAPAAASQAAAPTPPSHDEVAVLRGEVADLRARLEELHAQYEQSTARLQRDLDDMRRQLGV
jgi:uncharacterized protein YceH (UPF0502 family)